MSGRLLSIREAAEALGVSPAMIRDWIGQRRIAVVKFGTTKQATVRIEASEVERLIAEYRRPAFVRPTPGSKRRAS
jgi:excisionase family DNA binding protein